jgi:hypothetical protein
VTENVIDTRSIEDYRRFLRIKSLPAYRFVGHKAIFPDEYADFITEMPNPPRIRREMPSWMFDYQADITSMAVHRKKFAAFVDCGFGKTPILIEHSRIASEETGKRSLIVSPLMVHVAQIPRMKRTGGQGLFDFRGMNIRLAERSGLVFEYDWVVRKNPQSQAIRTKSREMQFSGLESDRAKSRGALPDYLLKFRAPGENAVPVRDWDKELDEDGDAVGDRRQVHDTQVSRNQWIDWAECCWADIRETDTLNIKGTKGEGDTKHICPLQLGVIERIIRLYSNPGELVFSPFAGIASEGYESLRLGRRFYGCELRTSTIERRSRIWNGR